MKVLFICGEHPFPANNGMRIPSWNMILKLSSLWSVSIYSIDDSPSKELEKKLEELNKVRFLPRRKSNVQLSNRLLNMLIKGGKFLLSKQPSFALDHPKKCISSDLQQIFLGNNFDLVILDSEFLAVYHPLLPSDSFNIISPNDSITLAWLNEIKYRMFSNPLVSLFKRENIARAKAFEAKYYNNFDLCHFVSEIDATFVSQFVPRNKVLVVSNGVEPFPPEHIIEPSKSINRVVIVGSLSGGNLLYAIRFIEEVWKKVHEIKPWMELTLVSRVTPKKYEDLFRSMNIKVSSFSGSLGMYYQSFGIVISPVLKDCGILNKVLEGMASGRPVFGYNCSFLGIPDAQNTKDYLSVESPAEFIELLLKAEDMAISLNEMGRRANKLALDNYNWDQKMEFFSDQVFSRFSMSRSN